MTYGIVIWTASELIERLPTHIHRSVCAARDAQVHRNTAALTAQAAQAEPRTRSVPYALRAGPCAPNGKQLHKAQSIPLAFHGAVAVVGKPRHVRAHTDLLRWHPRLTARARLLMNCLTTLLAFAQRYTEAQRAALAQRLVVSYLLATAILQLSLADQHNISVSDSLLAAQGDPIYRSP